MLISRAPSALRRTQRKLKKPAVVEEVMRQPRLRIRLTIQFRTLDVNVLVACVEADVANRGGVAIQRIRDAHFWEEGRNDEIHVLAAHGEEAHHRQRGEAAHCARVVVAGDAADGVVEAAGDVLVGVLR